ncbi:FAD-binding oxidoreductase [Rhizobium sp. YTU87027]|uniref:FAD-binding oxidoreductase n=1 Tax=Rhizobium sp. YTU87027 TaxID=3417741 RepID=UPI003D6806A4
MKIEDSVKAKLVDILGDRFSVNPSMIQQHARGEGHLPEAPPDAVGFPISTAEVSAVLKVCSAAGIPVIPWGAGTSLEGNVSALHGGLCVDLSKMNEIHAVNAADLDATVGPGVTRKQLNTYLRDTGLFFPVDPGADATIGGMAATRASGTNAVRYGNMKANVLALEVVLPSGDIIRTGSRARKSAAGYDLTSLFVGSEGTLGLITEVTLKLYGLPETIASGVSHFPTVEAAVSLVTEAVQLGMPLARVEFLDEQTMVAVNRFSKLDLPVAPTLFFEFHGSPVSVADQIEQVSGLIASHSGAPLLSSTDIEERNRLWHARHEAHYALLAMRPNSRVYGTDACVPISKLAECIRSTREDLERVPFFVSVIGHVGDGNFHLGMVIDPDDHAEFELAEEIHDRLIERTLRLGGTCSGEHGIGYGKTKYMQWEHGDALGTMVTLKRAFDPGNIMNPGKLLP